MKLCQEKEKAVVLVIKILKDSLWSDKKIHLHLRKKEVILNKMEKLKKQNQKKTANTSSLNEIQSSETKRSTPLQIKRKRKTKSELELADASAVSRNEKKHFLTKNKNAEKSQCEVRGLTAFSSDKSYCQEMKSSTSVVPTDQQGREEVRVIFDNVDNAILHS